MSCTENGNEGEAIIPLKRLKMKKRRIAKKRTSRKVIKGRGKGKRRIRKKSNFVGMGRKKRRSQKRKSKKRSQRRY